MSFSDRTFVVGLSASEPGTHASRRILINSDVLKASKIAAGDVLALASTEDTSAPKCYAVGIAWPSQELKSDTTLVSLSALLTAKLSEGAKTRLFPLSNPKLPSWVPSLRITQAARYVRLQQLHPASGKEGGSHFKIQGEKGKRKDWLPLLLREALVDVKYITPSQIVEIVYEGQARQYRVVAVSVQDNDTPTDDQIIASMKKLALDPAPALWTVGWDTFVSIVDEGLPSEKEKKKPSPVQGVESGISPDAYSAVGGLDKQIAEIRDLIEIPLTRPELFRHLGLKPPRGVLLHGPPGTGKTHLARAIAASTRSSVIVINGPELSSAYHGETESKIRDVFAEARSKSPCIVVLDEVDALCPRREEGPGGEVEKRVVAQLLTIMDGMEDEGEDGKDRVVVVATTNRPNAIDPALRRPGRFDREIEIGIPDAEARCSILKVVLSKAPHTLSDEDIKSIATRAHGYVGADLSAIIREAGTSAIKRWVASHPADASAQPELTMSDMLSALTSVRPSTMRSVFLDTVPVRYHDIGGQADTIQRLRECIEWPLLHPDAFERLGVRPPKGVLLYGPPGCSKTLLVRACATESGVNFVAVKGPELLNKYLGESERGVREIFRKARAAAPSIVFFDEIDALATSRGSDASSHEGVLTSLLNEMDGVEELVGVTVVAATNRPDTIDSALMRPGRLDRIIYVGPPDQQGREEILHICTRKMSIEPGLDFRELARLTDGCSGAELAALCQEAALQTMRRNVKAKVIPCEAFYAAAGGVRRQISVDVIAGFNRWQEANCSLADA